MDLQHFCAPQSDERDHLRAPWVKGAWVYATNGHVCVRVPAASRPDVTASPEKAPDAGSLFERWLESEPSDSFLVMPDLPPLELCKSCRGKRWFLASRCSHCQDGLFQHMGLSYECRNCEGEPVDHGWLVSDSESGTAKECTSCWGRGAEKGTFALGGVHFELAYLKWLAALPQVRVRIHVPTEENWNTVKGVPPSVFIFDGGQALLMPRRT